MKFPHQKLIKDQNIRISVLPKDLQDLFELFDKKLDEYETAEEQEDEPEVLKLKQELQSMSREIMSEIIEYLEDEELGEEEGEQKEMQEEKIPKDKEGILRFLFNKGITIITKEQLKEYGYPVGFWAGDGLPMKGETIGHYRLFRDNTSQPYQIVKTKK